MNIFERINEKYEEITKNYLKKLEELDKETEVAQKLPQEIQEYDDCIYASYWDWDKSLSIVFQKEDTIKKLKMLGVQGFRKAFWGDVTNDPKSWKWADGKIEIDGITFKFAGGNTQKPAACIIEEYEEPAKPATKKLRAICTETGKEV